MHRPALCTQVLLLQSCCFRQLSTVVQGSSTYRPVRPRQPVERWEGGSYATAGEKGLTPSFPPSLILIFLVFSRLLPPPAPSLVPRLFSSQTPCSWSHFVVPCCAVIYFAVLCLAVPCCTVMWYAVESHVMCRAVTVCAMPCTRLMCCAVLRWSVLSRALV